MYCNVIVIVFINIFNEYNLIFSTKGLYEFFFVIIFIEINVKKTYR